MVNMSDDQPRRFCPAVDHAAARHNDEIWRRTMRDDGVQRDEHGRPALRLGTCIKCGSTISRDVKR